jgi:hypothetical protein
MPKNQLTRRYTVVNGGGTDTIDLSSSDSLYVVDGTATLTSGYTIDTTGTSVINTVIRILWAASVTLNGETVTVLGRAMKQQEVNKDGIIEATYNGSSWDIVVINDLSGVNLLSGVETTTLTSGGGTLNLNPDTSENTQVLDGSATLSSSWTVQGSGTPVAGDKFTVIYTSTLTVGANTVTIFGQQLTSSQALAGDLVVTAIYDGTTWQSVVTQNATTTSWVETAFLQDNSVTLAKLQGITRGNTIVGDASGDPALLDCSADDSIVGGDGNDIKSLTQDTGNSNVTYNRNGAGTFTLNVDSGTNSLEQYDESNSSPTANTVTGANSTATGTNNTVSADTSHVNGSNNTISGSAGGNVHGDSCTVTQSGFAAGSNCSSTGVYAMAGGRSNTASGNRSAAWGGQSNQALGEYDFVTGFTNVSDASSTGQTLTGRNNTSTGSDTFATNSNNSPSGDKSSAFGEYAQPTRTAQWSLSSGKQDTGNASTYAQLSGITAFKSTTDATPATLEIGGTGTGTISIPSEGMFKCKVEATCYQTGGSSGTAGDAAAWEISFCIKRVGSATSLLGTPTYWTDAGTGSATPQTYANDAALGATIVITADDTNESVSITATGEANKNLDWQAAIIGIDSKHS